MRTFSRFLFLVVAMLGLCHAADDHANFEITVKPFIFDFIVDEPVDVPVSIRNRTGAPLTTDAGDVFACEVTRLNSRDREVTRYAKTQLPVVDIKPGETWEGFIRLTDLYEMRAEGDYFVRFRAANRLGASVSDGLLVSVIPGIPIKYVRQMFADGTQREFRLVYLQRYQINEYLYLRIIDPSGVRAWDTVSMGMVFRKEAPKLDITDDGVVTVLHRATRDLHVKLTLESTHDSVRITGEEVLLDPEAMARTMMEPFQKKALEPPPPPEPWWKFW